MEVKERFRSPLYIQLKEVIRSKIDEGEYAPGTAIPSENQLAEAYGINRISVHSALAALEGEGMLKSVQGKGFFVVGPKLERDMVTLGGFRQSMREREQLPTTKVLVKALRRAGPLYSGILKVSEDEDIWYVRRICLSNGEPVALEEIFIRADAVPGFEDVDINLFSIFEVYRWNGIKPARGEQTLAITRLDPGAARFIGITDKTPVLRFSGATCDGAGNPVEYARSYTRHDKCDFVVHFRRQD